MLGSFFGWRLRVSLAGLILASNIGSPARATPCDGILATTASSEARRDLQAVDLVRLRDIGLPDSALYRDDDALSVSPDRRSLAFVVRRADPASNTYCQALAVISTFAAGAKPIILDQWVGFLPEPPQGIRGLITGSGVPAQNTPQWSPDGKSVAWLKADKQFAQVSVVDIAARTSRMLTNLSTNVDRVKWSADGRTLLIESRPQLGAAAVSAIASEGQRGFRYDDRYMPAQGDSPRVAEPVKPVFTAVEVATGNARGTSEEERASFDQSFGQDAPLRADAVTTSSSQNRAWIARNDDTLFSAHTVWVSRPGRLPRQCGAEACRGDIFGVYWGGDGSSLFILKREGWKGERTALYRLDGNGSRSNRLLSTLDTLASCTILAGNLVCLRDGATAPRRLVAIDLTSGRETVFFDPNPEFASLNLGSVRRLHWRNAYGLEAWGDLVLPPGYRGGQKLPLIVVQYHSDGFLRGGTGDEYPILLFAARGYAVLSLEQPLFIARTLPGVKDWKEANLQNGIGWRERYSLLSSIETGVRIVINSGIADPAKIGITGLSDGATSVQFAMIHSKLFAAAAMSSCCIDPNTVMIYGGPRWAAEMRRRGYPPASSFDRAFWKPMSLALNASKVTTPLLLQLPSDEYLLALESFGALRESGKPVDMLVFPNEHHVKWQPAHRLAIYQRNLDWFDFWLRDYQDPEPEKAAQYAYWSALARERGNSSSIPVP